MSSVPQAETENQVLMAITSVTRGRDVLAALATAWSSSAGQLGARDNDDNRQPPLHPDVNTRSAPIPRVVR